LTADDPHQGHPVFRAGADLAEAPAAVILIHGRGAGADDILGLASYFGRPDFGYLAPEAAGRVWYPRTFMEPQAVNQPWLDSALRLLGSLVGSVAAAGIPAERTFIGGFSQGACLSSEFVARNPRRYGGLFVLSGGLIGDRIDPAAYEGALDGTPVLVGCSDIDPHVPLARVKETAEILRSLGATVDERIYPGMPHTVNEDEIAAIRALLGKVPTTRP
jgi:predicted esterase